MISPSLYFSLIFLPFSMGSTFFLLLSELDFCPPFCATLHASHHISEFLQFYVVKFVELCAKKTWQA